MGYDFGVSVLAENSPFNDFEALRVATGNFSDQNKLGEGGFGAVYKVNSLFVVHESDNR